MLLLKLFSPLNVGYIVTLRELYAGHNKIKDIPPELGECKALERLMLNHNVIERIPEELGQCSKLHTVDLSFNKINLLPPGMIQFKLSSYHSSILCRFGKNSWDQNDQIGQQPTRS